MKKGFTIVEIIVAIGIFGLTVLAILGYFAYSSKIIRNSRNTTIASNLASGLIDENLAKSYEELTPQTGTKTKFSTDANNPFFNFQYQTNITLIDSDLANSSSDVGLKKIDVWVYWPDGVNEKNLQMSTVTSQK